MKGVPLVLAVSAVIQSGCGQDPKITIPSVEGYAAPPEDVDLYPLYDRAYYERTLPADGQCRVRYASDWDYSIFSGNQMISEQTSPDYLYAAQYADEYAARGACRKQPEPCQIAELRHGYTITISGDRLNLAAVKDWEELARQINQMSRHGICQLYTIQ